MCLSTHTFSVSQSDAFPLHPGPIDLENQDSNSMSDAWSQDRYERVKSLTELLDSEFTSYYVSKGFMALKWHRVEHRCVSRRKYGCYTSQCVRISYEVVLQSEPTKFSSSDKRRKKEESTDPNNGLLWSGGCYLYCMSEVDEMLDYHSDWGSFGYISHLQ